MPQGSCNGLVYYCLYASTLRYHIDQSISLNAFADDHLINDNFDPNNSDLEQNTNIKLESNLCEIHHWMTLNRLKMNMAKTEIIYFGSHQCLLKSARNTTTVVYDC